MYYINSLLSGIENKFYGYNPSYVSCPSEESVITLKSFPEEIWDEIFKNLSISDNKYVCSISKKMNESFVEKFILYQLIFDKIKPSFKEKYRDYDDAYSFESTHVQFHHFDFKIPYILISIFVKNHGNDAEAISIAQKNNSDILLRECWNEKRMITILEKQKIMMYFSRLQLTFLHDRISHEQENNISKIVEYFNKTIELKSQHARNAHARNFET